MYISGVIPFSCKKEKLAAWVDLKKEFGDKVKIIFQEKIITYSAKVDRNYHC